MLNTHPFLLEQLVESRRRDLLRAAREHRSGRSGQPHRSQREGAHPGAPGAPGPVGNPTRSIGNYL